MPSVTPPARGPTNTAASPPQFDDAQAPLPDAAALAAEPAAPARHPRRRARRRPARHPTARSSSRAKRAHPLHDAGRGFLQIEAHYDCLRWYAKKPDDANNNAGKNTVCGTTPTTLTPPSRGRPQPQQHLPRHRARRRRLRRRPRRRPSRPTRPSSRRPPPPPPPPPSPPPSPPPPSPPCPPPPSPPPPARAAVASAAVAPALASAAVATAAVPAAPPPPPAAEPSPPPPPPPPIIELEYNGTGSIDEPIHLDNTIIKFQGGYVQRCDVVVWVRGPLRAHQRGPSLQVGQLLEVARAPGDFRPPVYGGYTASERGRRESPPWPWWACTTRTPSIYRTTS